MVSEGNYMSEKIDIVIPWVDGNDKNWQKERSNYEALENGQDEWKDGDVRYRDWDNLQYVFRGIEKFMPWVHRIFFVTWGHIPEWLDKNNPKLEIVTHQQFIPKEYLPTFNSQTIDLNIYRIPNLSEHFIYFNDDTFVLKETKPTDFFKNGIPCTSAIMSPVPLVKEAGNADINNMRVLNAHFDKKQVLKKNITKWFNLRYGLNNYRNLALLPWTRFVGIYQQHLPNSMLKSTYEKIWKAEFELLDKTSREKFREDSFSVNQWLISEWQIAMGDFIPRKLSIGQRFEIESDDVLVAASEYIKKQKGKLVCINDSNLINDFDEAREKINRAFASVLGDSSTFEIHRSM